MSNEPNAFGNNSIEWINLLEQGVPYVCPSCGIIYQGAKFVANSPMFSDETKNLAGVVCGVLLLFSGALLADKLIAKFT